MCSTPDTEVTRSQEIRKYEPILGTPGTSAWSVFTYRLKLFFLVDLPSKASVFVWISTWMAWKLLDRGKLASDVAIIAVVGLMVLAWMNWCMRKHVGPFIEAICDWLRGSSKPNIVVQTGQPTPSAKPDIPETDK
jgi:hypothetical protein